ncbi:colicin D domain-containing protein [Saccharopolyspora pogona]|uniref:colicin D domain-containing protein n=1 Tax=Saccharopolyspora pogona TaxID=333966 RepID=UPI0016837A30|nr:colicin D domain-containing protein [Saccharopolyspora pogona]
MSAPLPPLAPAPEPGPGIPVDVRPEDYYRVAQDFVDGQNQVMRSYETLTRSLDALSGAAGNDEPAQKFSESYTPAVRTLFAGFVRLHELLGGIARGLAISADNHRRADAEAAGVDPGEGFAPLWPDKCPAASEPPPILGDGDTNLLAKISDWVNPYYPNGHVDKMHDVATAFAAARDSLNDIANDLHARLQSLASNNITEDLDALESFWQKVAAGDDTLISALPATCDALANSCSDYAISVKRTRNTIGDIVEETSLELAAVTGIAFVASLLTTPVGGFAVEGGAGAAVLDAAGVRMAAVATEFVITLGGAVTTVAAVEANATLAMTINNTPDPNVTQTETTQVGERAGTSETTAPELKIDRKQIEKKYDRHAPDFGVDKPRSKEAFDEFEKAIRDFTQRPDLERMSGTYRGDPVFFQVDKNTGLFVMQKPTGEFLSGWRLNPDQLTNVLTRGKL